ncbi:unnamed protein product [Trichogramma brassicae]|uniref:Uncharacterized protein n=1 Tax=Trichogramma brassicae TaxID=86971 RepID=A0A6H5IQ46_9HYME|nr:unnamed protein product [Trichogramma brassicae]
MVRGLSQWTKTLSFPSRISPQRKESKLQQVSPSVSPTSTAATTPMSTMSSRSNAASSENLHDKAPTIISNSMNAEPEVTTLAMSNNNNHNNNNNTSTTSCTSSSSYSQSPRVNLCT